MYAKRRGLVPVSRLYLEREKEGKENKMNVNFIFCEFSVVSEIRIKVAVPQNTSFA